LIEDTERILGISRFVAGLLAQAGQVTDQVGEFLA
jgi:hypothetical protein